MTDLPSITICGVQELDEHDLKSLSHVISIWDPVWAERETHEEQFRRKLGTKTQVHFAYLDDIPTSMDNRSAATYEQIAEILTFAQSIDRSSSVLIHCWAGISRSTAVAYAVLCQIAGPGTEKECLDLVRRLRPEAAPNSLIVTLAEATLGRNGKMFEAYDAMISHLFIPCDDDEL